MQYVSLNKSKCMSKFGLSQDLSYCKRAYLPDASRCLNADNIKLESVVKHRHALAASSWTNQVKCIHNRVD